jgi:hypothetical protein
VKYDHKFKFLFGILITTIFFFNEKGIIQEDDEAMAEWDNKIGYELGILDEIFQEELNILRGMFIGKIIDGESYKDRV